MQWMQLFDLACNFQRTREGYADIANSDRHGITIDDNIATLFVNDQSRAVVVAIGNTGQDVG